jgi:hypothetical protein
VRGLLVLELGEEIGEGRAGVEGGKDDGEHGVPALSR